MPTNRTAARCLARLVAGALVFPFGAAAASPAAPPASLENAVGTELPVLEYRLPNGLRVLFHVDRSDPVVAVALGANVGSGREQQGRTGLAHLFEHLFFLDSENLGPGGLDKLSTKVGGSGASGNTSRDVTIYHQAVPSEALEKMLWAEADKLGFFINTLTDQALASERQVVKNEKRQAIDNQPYGKADLLVLSALYPARHPYSHDVIGSLADLDAASLGDVREFYMRWYRPNNATLVIAGDFDPVEARAWVDRYFGEIPAGPAVAPPEPEPAVLQGDRRIVYEDRFAPLPMLTIAWPSVPADHPDGPALDVLLDLLSSGTDAPLTRALATPGLAERAAAHQHAGRVSGELYVEVQGFEGATLDRVLQAIEEGLRSFEENGVQTGALQRAKALREMGLYRSLGGVEDKAELIARFVGMTGRPDFADVLLARLREVDARDIDRVYRQYVKDKPRVVLSIVPLGQIGLAVPGSQPVRLAEETPEAAPEPIAAATAPTPAARTASAIDRRTEPAFGQRPARLETKIWTDRLPGGLALSGIVDRERPIVSFELAMDGGRMLESPGKEGAANLLARLLLKGTERRGPEELEAALGALGAEFAVEAQTEHLVLRGHVLARHFPAAAELLREILTEPRWDETEFIRAKTTVLAEIKAASSRPERVARQVFNKAIYARTDPRAWDPLGVEASVKALSMKDLQDLFARAADPSVSRIRLVGSVGSAEAVGAFRTLAASWRKPHSVRPPLPADPVFPTNAAMHFRDVPGAKQTAMLFGRPAMRRADPDYYPATIMNFALGGGGFASRLVRELREKRGFTYGIRSRFEPARTGGLFTVETSVRTDATAAAAGLIRDILRDYPATVTDGDLAMTKESLTRSRARAGETADAKLRILADIGDYGLPLDYKSREEAAIAAISLQSVRDLASRYVRPDRLTYVFVGDANSQRAPLQALGLGALSDVGSADGVQRLDSE